MNDVRKGPGDLPGDSSNPNSPDYDARFDELVDELVEQYRDDPAQVERADQWWEGTLDGDTYTAIEKAMADFGDRVPGSFLRLTELAKVASEARAKALREVAENDATIQLDREDNISHEMRFGSEP